MPSRHPSPSYLVRFLMFLCSPQLCQCHYVTFLTCLLGIQFPQFCLAEFALCSRPAQSILIRVLISCLFPSSCHRHQVSQAAASPCLRFQASFSNQLPQFSLSGPGVPALSQASRPPEQLASSRTFRPGCSLTTISYEFSVLSTLIVYM